MIWCNEVLYRRTPGAARSGRRCQGVRHIFAPQRYLHTDVFSEAPILTAAPACRHCSVPLLAAKRQALAAESRACRTRWTVCMRQTHTEACISCSTLQETRPVASVLSATKSADSSQAAMAVAVVAEQGVALATVLQHAVPARHRLDMLWVPSTLMED
jgi:hypothetical protein